MKRKMEFSMSTSNKVAKRKPGAPRGNKNRVIAQEEQKRGRMTSTSMKYEEWLWFCEAADLAEGHSLTEEEYMEKWHDLMRLAVREFIREHRGLAGPAIIA